MTSGRYASQRGFTIVELIVVGVIAIGVVALGSAAWSASDGTKRNACVNQLNTVIAARATWAATASPATPNGDADQCKTVIELTTKYNAQCADRTGSMPVPTCG